MPLAKSSGEMPMDVAVKVADALNAEAGLGQATAAQRMPFVNIELDFATYGPQILSEVENLGEKFGHYREFEDPEVVIVDYSGPNVAKNMTLAHLRSTIIGKSLTRIEEARGNVAFGINHLGDWGTQFGAIIYQYKQNVENDDEFLERLSQDPPTVLMETYRQFNDEVKSAPGDVAAAMKESARSIFLSLEQGNPEYVELWEHFLDWSMQGFDPVYERLGVDFDAIQGESFYEDKMVPVVEEAKEKGVLTQRSDGATVFPAQVLIDPETKQELPSLMWTKGKRSPDQPENAAGTPRDEIVVKPSGGTVYIARDLAAVVYRARDLGADRLLYVVGKEQQGHFIELFNMAHQMGAVALGNARHIWFGHLNVDGRKMKSREGKVVLLSDTIDDAVEAAEQATLRRNQEADAEERTLSREERLRAEMLGVSALAFNDLKQDHRKDIEFTPELVGKLAEGGAAYIQYTHARLNSVLEKVGEVASLERMPETLSATERKLLIDISRLPRVIEEAAEGSEPHKIATYLTDICLTVNSFYNDKQHPVLAANDPTVRSFRAHLVKATRQVIENTSALVCVSLPGEM